MLDDGGFTIDAAELFRVFEAKRVEPRGMSQDAAVHVSITIYCEKYNFNGSSKAKYMRAFIATEDEYTVARVLRRFWEHRESIPLYAGAEDVGSPAGPNQSGAVPPGAALL
jgi:hypothetical protein